MPRHLPPTDTFSIAFETREMPGKIIATTVTLRREIVSDPKATFRLDLSDHPLYRELVAYVKANPVRS